MDSLSADYGDLATTEPTEASVAAQFTIVEAVDQELLVFAQPYQDGLEIYNPTTSRVGEYADTVFDPDYIAVAVARKVEATHQKAEVVIRKGDVGQLREALNRHLGLWSQVDKL